MSSYRLSDRADEELFDILLYSVEQFGLHQATTYRSGLENCFSLLADNPRLGRLAEQIGKGVRRHEHGSHVILYEEADEGVTILGLVHKRNQRNLKV